MLQCQRGYRWAEANMIDFWRLRVVGLGQSLQELVAVIAIVLR